MPRENQGASLGKTAVISTAGGMVIGVIPVVSTLEGEHSRRCRGRWRSRRTRCRLNILSWQTDRVSSTKSYNPSGNNLQADHTPVRETEYKQVG